MHYLICEHCGEPNPLYAEAPASCTSCGKKMKRNYIDWKAKNPEKSFQQYCETVGTQDLLSGEKAMKSRTKRGHLIAIVSGIVLLLLVLKFVDFTPNLKDVPVEWVNSKWTTFSPPNSLLQLELPPVKMEPFEREIKQEVQEYIEWANIFKGTDSTYQMEILFREHQYVPSIKLNPLEEMATSTISMMKINKFDCEQSNMEISGNRAILLKGISTAGTPSQKKHSGN